MHELRISLFGSVCVRHSNLAAEPKLTRTLQALLAYLLLNGHGQHPREALAELFWGDQPPSKARRCLNTALWRLRRLLEPRGIPAGTYLTTNTLGEVGFNWLSEHWLDVEIFERETTRLIAQPVESIPAAHVQELEQVLELYSRELLEGLYDDWALRERERLRLLYLKGQAYLLGYYRTHARYEEALQAGECILQQDPLREEIHREMMRLYAATGQRARAVRQYETCRAVLAAELQLPPMEETLALYAALLEDGTAAHAEDTRRASTAGPADPPLALGRSADIALLLAELDKITRTLNQIQIQLRDNLEQIERLANRASQSSPAISSHPRLVSRPGPLREQSRR